MGEDAAGLLPTCFIYLLGTEWEFFKGKLATNIGLEYIDTRTNLSQNRNCGPNLAYNNTYSYTNYGVVLGEPIDTESKSISFWGSTELSPNTKINYTIENVVINDSNAIDYRISSSKQNSWLTVLGISWEKNSYTLKGDINHQKISYGNSKNPKGLNLNAIYSF